MSSLLLGYRGNLYWCSIFNYLKKCVQTKKNGGLGLKNLHPQNNCLPIKFSSKVVMLSTSPWLDWVNLHHPNAFINPHTNTSFIFKTINTQLPSLQQVSFVLTNNGQNTYFWYDTWLYHSYLATVVPNLHLHTPSNNTSKWLIFYVMVKSLTCGIA